MVYLPFIVNVEKVDKACHVPDCGAPLGGTAHSIVDGNVALLLIWVLPSSILRLRSAQE